MGRKGEGLDWYGEEEGEGLDWYGEERKEERFDCMGGKERGLDWYGEERRGVRLVWGGKERG